MTNYFKLLKVDQKKLRSGEDAAREEINKAYGARLGQMKVGFDYPGIHSSNLRKELRKAQDCLLDPDQRKKHAAELAAEDREPRRKPRQAKSWDGASALESPTVRGALAALPAALFYLLARGVGEPSGGAALVALVLAVLFYQLGYRWLKSLFFAVAATFVLRLSASGFDGLAESVALSPAAAALVNMAVFMAFGAVAGGTGFVAPLNSWSRRHLARVTLVLLAVVGSVYAAGVALPPGSGDGPGPDPPGAVNEPGDPPPSEIEARLDLDRDEQRRIQMALRELGFYQGAIDSNFGPLSRTALQEWQRTQTGVATSYLDARQAQTLLALAPVPERPSDPTNGAGPTDPEPEVSRVVVRAEPGSRIIADGEVAGTTNEAGILLLPGLQAGQHVLVAEKSGFETVTREIEIVPGRSQVIELVLEALPGSLSVQANVDGALVAIDGGATRPLPLVRLAVPSGMRQVAVQRLGYEPVVENIEVRPGELATMDVVLEPVEIDDDIAVLRRLFDGGNYDGAAQAALTLANLLDLWEQAGLDVAEPLGITHAILGRSLYELDRFQESSASLYRAILLREEVILPINHRHGGGGFREGFCRGFLSLSLAQIAFRSIDDPEHGFAVARQQVSGVTVTQQVNGQVFRVDTEVQDRGSMDFIHPDAQRRRQDPDSGLVTELACRGCDGSLAVHAALLRRLSQP